MNAEETLKSLRKIVPLERKAKSPKDKASLARQRRDLERVLLDTESYDFDWEPFSTITAYASKVLKGRFPAGEELLLKLVDPQDSYGPEAVAEYAIKAVKGRWKAGEYCIAEDIDAWEMYLAFLRRKDKKALVEACKSRDVFAMWYAEEVAKGEWKPGEKALLKGKEWCVLYYARAMGRRWLEGEKVIVAGKDPQTCFEYATEVVRGRWEEGEKIILKNPKFCVDYAEEIIQGRWLEGEKTILKDPYMCHSYAKDVIKGRWEEAEKVFIKDPEFCYMYARDIIKGRLPEHMHQAMVMYSFSQPGNQWVKKYLSAKKYNRVA